MFTSLEQRMARSYLDLFPKFIPEKNSEISTVEQETFYLLMKKIYDLAYDEPQLFVATLHEDDAYPNRFNKNSYGKPELLINMKKFTKTLDEFINNMFLLGQGVDVKLNKRQKAILARLEVDNENDLPVAWRWMATRSGANLVDFSHCFFQSDYPYLSDIYAELLGETAFRKLEHWMLEQGYQRYTIVDAKLGDCKLSLVYANTAWSKETPTGGFEYKIKHTGIAIRYDTYISKPCVFGLCIPNGLKMFLEHFELMDRQTKDFVLTYTKKCNGCRYCVQTDKTGTRPLAFMQMNDSEQQYRLCPYFPGCNYCFTSIDDTLADQIIGMLGFMDQYIMVKGN